MSGQVNSQARPFDLTKNGSSSTGRYARQEGGEHAGYYRSTMPYTGASDRADLMEHPRQPQLGHSREHPKPMERVISQTSDMRGGGNRKEHRFIRMLRSDKDKKLEFDTTTISEPLAVVESAPLVASYRPRPGRPTRPGMQQGLDMPPPSPATTNANIDPSKLATGRNDWRKAYPVRPASLSKPSLQESEQECGSNKRSRRSYNLDRLSITAVLDDAKAVGVGVAVSPNNPDTSFSKHNEREMSVKQARRCGMVFEPADIDLAMLAGQWSGGNDGFPSAGPNEEPEATEELSLPCNDKLVDGNGNEDGENSNDRDSPSPKSSDSDVPEIRVISPPRSVSVVSNQYLSPGHAWKRIAERCRREAKKEHDDAEEILELCAPLLAAFELIKSTPEFADSDSWDGAFEVVQLILHERELNARERDEANARAVWFQQQWWNLHQEVAQFRSEHPTSHEA